MTTPTNTPADKSVEEKQSFTRPFKYDPDGQIILDSENNLALSVRGCGLLKSDEKQDAFGESVCNALNEYDNLRLHSEALYEALKLCYYRLKFTDTGVVKENPVLQKAQAALTAYKQTLKQP